MVIIGCSYSWGGVAEQRHMWKKARGRDVCTTSLKWKLSLESSGKAHVRCCFSDLLQDQSDCETADPGSAGRKEQGLRWGKVGGTERTHGWTFDVFLVCLWKAKIFWFEIRFCIYFLTEGDRAFDAFNTGKFFLDGQNNRYSLNFLDLLSKHLRNANKAD